MTEFIRPYIARVVASLVTIIAGVVAGWGMTVAPEAFAGLQQFLTEITLGAGLLVYGIVHTMIERKFGKSDG